MDALIVLSHLRWNFVFQRPQQLMSRLRKNFRIWFVEEPVLTDGPPRLVRTRAAPGIEILVPHTSIEAPGFHDDQMPTLQRLLSDFVAAEALGEPLVWLYTPMAFPLLGTLRARAVVYDCMDELSAFQGAPVQLRQREAQLLARADLVITGGPAIYAAKRDLHPNIHCLPSAVDASHYAPAGLDAAGAHGRAAQALQAAGIGRPRLGYFGVIDERLDIELLAMLAAERPTWQFVMVGPVVKIDPARLPRRANLHWLGMQPYDLLPHLMAGWDVCLMPFALNEATRFISPTKTLEYLAGEKPVVSTPIGDVIDLYGECVHVASAGPDFLDACEAVLAQTPEERVRHKVDCRALVRRVSWDAAAGTVLDLLDELLEAPLQLAAPPSVVPTRREGPATAASESSSLARG